MNSDMETQVHHLEQEAYSSVLRAFLAQSDSISWDQLELITHLRRELRVSDQEHKELYGRVKDDEIVQRIKEWRQAGQNQATTLTAHQAAHDSSVLLSHKKQKTSHSGPPFTIGTPSQVLQPQLYSAAKQGELPGGRGKKYKPGQRFRSLSSVESLPHPSTGHVLNGRFTNRSSSGAPVENESAEATASRDPLIGRKVLMRWPEDNNFYEAVITDYDPFQGRHAVVYDMNTVRETWEYVNLKEIPPEDIRWVGKDPGLSRHEGPIGQGRGGKKSTSHCTDGVPGSGRGIIQSRKEFPSLQNGGIRRKVSDDIEIVDTDTLIKEVERIFGASNPDPLEIAKAKKMLREHEEALVNAITKLADASDGESDGDQTLSHGQSVDGGRDGRKNQQNGGELHDPGLEAEMAERQAHCQDGDCSDVVA